MGTKMLSNVLCTPCCISYMGTHWECSCSSLEGWCERNNPRALQKHSEKLVQIHQTLKKNIFSYHKLANSLAQHLFFLGRFGEQRVPLSLAVHQPLHRRNFIIFWSRFLRAMSATEPSTSGLNLSVSLKGWLTLAPRLLTRYLIMPVFPDSTAAASGVIPENSSFASTSTLNSKTLTIRWTRSCRPSWTAKTSGELGPIL